MELESELEQKTMLYSNKRRDIFFKCSVDLTASVDIRMS